MKFLHTLCEQRTFLIVIYLKEFFHQFLLLSVHRGPQAYVYHPSVQGPVPPYRGHLHRAQRQPPSLDFSAELFGLSITSAPIRLISKKKTSVPNFRHLSSGELMIHADAMELAAKNTHQRHNRQRHLGIIGTQY